jgi:hypothetical protein
MSWWRKLIEKWQKFIEDTGKANEEMWKSQQPSCCIKDRKEEEK